MAGRQVNRSSLYPCLPIYLFTCPLKSFVITYLLIYFVQEKVKHET